MRKAKQGIKHELTHPSIAVASRPMPTAAINNRDSGTRSSAAHKMIDGAELPQNNICQGLCYRLR